ncbi:MAG: hypothetical protein R6W87_00880 [Halospina sp.]
MEPQLKRTLLLRKFSSIEYMEECQSYFRKALDVLDEALAYFEQHYSQDDWKNWHPSEWPTTWRDRAQNNLENLYASLKQGIQQYQSGDPDRLRGTCNGLTALSKDMDGMGEKWWSYVPSEYEERFIRNRREAVQRASNIRRTIGGYWKTPDSVLKETVTGPVDEQDLLRFLDPGEQP